ncbi:organic hydroperoxide resistance protein [Shimia sp. NS0008-38b]|uniref:organic hydroperoxide resistance protein n=1 Tax=Shimia sp. NS0008-38b TaxID=3127653 RepID=UPI00310655AA
MLQSTLYATSAIATGGREGHVTSVDGKLDVMLSTPKELGGAGGSGTNPEQMFAAGYAACFLSALKLMASQQNQTLSEDTSVTTTVGIGPRTDGGFGLDVALKIAIPSLDKDVAEKLIADAHVTCPYSHATKGSLTITPELA